MSNVSFFGKHPRVRTILKSVFGFSSVLVVALALVFLVTKGVDPKYAELSFIEHSVLGTNSGQVVPASCESVPPWSHSPSDCPQMCQLSTNPLVANNTHLNPNYDYAGQTGNICICNNKYGNPPDCNGGVTVKFTPSGSSANNPFISINSFTIDGISGTSWVDQGMKGTLAWNVTGAGVTCTAGGTGGWPQGAIASTGSWTSGVNKAVVDVVRSYILTCTNGVQTLSQTVYGHYIGSSSGSTGATCFTEGSKVTMVDGSAKHIEDVVTGDVVKTSRGGVAVGVVHHNFYTGYLYAFNRSDHYFVTGTHPFMTTEGWKAVDPVAAKKENPTLAIGKLSVGDVLIKEDGTKVPLSAIDHEYTEGMVYNIEVPDVHDYFVDGYWVHNKVIGSAP